MTRDALDRLRANNPLPHGSSAPELETLLGRLETIAPGPRRLRPFRPLVPILGVAVALGVLIGALGVLRAGHRAPVGRHHVSRQPVVVPAAPKGGMPGFVFLSGAGLASSSGGVISLQQCLGCRDDGNQTAHSRDLYWLARTVDGGRHWSLTKEHYSIEQPLFVGQDGWAGGLEAAGPQAGGIAEYYVTHDGGRTWRVAPAAAPNEGGALVSVGGGEVWATGVTPTNVTILHAPVAGSRLGATASQPIHGSWTNVQVMAGGSGTAYVFNADAPRQTFVTHDDGRTWQRMQPPCPSGERGGLTAAYGDTIWADCNSPTSQQQALERSDSGGRSWQRLHPGPAGPVQLQPVSAEAGWAVSGHDVLRTTDGGATWSAVWSEANSQPPSLRSQLPPPIAAGPNPLLIAQSPTSASLVVAIAHGRLGQHSKLTNLVVYRTTDGGRTWQPYIVPLGNR